MTLENTINALDLVYGVPSPITFGQASSTPGDSIPEVFSLLSPQMLTEDSGGKTAWQPAVTTLKNGGVWTDSNVENGRTLVSAPVGNVIETIRLVIKDAGGATRAQTMARLNRLIALARNFHADEAQPAPVYMQLRYQNAPGYQYALIYDVGVAVELDPYLPEPTSYVTLSIEREPYWRGVPPGANPKIWAFYKNGWKQSSALVAGANEWNYVTLGLMNTFANNESLKQGIVKHFDEIGTSNVNYLDLDGNANFSLAGGGTLTDSLLIDGDAPALALITWQAKSTGASKLYIARSTRPDLYPGNNNNTSTQRMRNTFNGGDITVNSGNPTVTIVANANGVLSNGSTVNRFVLQLVYAAGTIAGTSVGSWTRVINQYPGRYAAYMRAQVTAGTVTATKFYLEASTGSTNINFQQTTPVKLNQTAFGLTYLGELDFTFAGSKQISSNGLGMDIATTFNLRLGTLKTSAETPTVLVWDVVLMPLDESGGMIVIDFATLTSNDYAWLDKTGYFTGGHVGDAAVTRQSSSDNQRRLTGAAIELLPNKVNRLYFLPDLSAPNPTAANEVRVDIVPRWSLLRDF